MPPPLTRERFEHTPHNRHAKAAANKRAAKNRRLRRATKRGIREMLERFALIGIPPEAR